MGNTKADVRNRVMKIWTGLNWLRTGFHDRFLKLLYECSSSTNLGEFSDNEHWTRRLLRQSNDGEAQRGQGGNGRWIYRTRVGKQGFAPIVRPRDHGMAHSDTGKQWLKLLFLLTLLLLLILKAYSTDFLASRPPFRATGRQLRHNVHGSYVTALTYDPVACS